MSQEPKQPAERDTNKDQPSLQQPSVGESNDGGEGVIVTRGGAEQGREALKNAEATTDASDADQSRDHNDRGGA
jgi:hypothetical protein